MNGHEKAWKNADRAVTQLEAFLAPQPEPHNADIVRAAIIKAFEFSFEIVWKLIQKVAADEGVVVNSPKSALAFGFAQGWFDDERLCLAMLEDRNRTVHTYNVDTAKSIADAVRSRYVVALRNALSKLS